MKKKEQRYVLVNKQGREIMNADSFWGLIGQMVFTYFLVAIIFGFIGFIVSLFN